MSLESEKPAKVSQESVTNQKKPQICKFYLQKRCKHGVKGGSCSFSHPKLCFNHIKGDCDKTNCEYYHPKLCKEAVKYNSCARRYCKFYHPRVQTLEQALEGKSRMCQVQRTIK